MNFHISQDIRNNLTLYQKLFFVRFLYKWGLKNDILQGDRYAACLNKKGDLWVGEAQQQEDFMMQISQNNHFLEAHIIPPNSHQVIFFDWLSTLNKIPSYAHNPDPKHCKLHMSYCAPGKRYIKSAETLEDVPIENDFPLYRTMLDKDGYPLSPFFLNGHSTGVKGRGVLGLWGPNNAGDAIITRRSKQNKLQVVLIERNDGSDTYAFPGGFVDSHEVGMIFKTIIREFLEECVGFDNYKSNISTLQEIFGDFKWHKETQSIELKTSDNLGRVVYKGIVNDERNTDHAWIETVAVHWHLHEKQAEKLKLKAGDDAKAGSAAFYDIVDDPILNLKKVKPRENLFASHSDILNEMIKISFPDEFT